MPAKEIIAKLKLDSKEFKTQEISAGLNTIAASALAVGAALFASTKRTAEYRDSTVKLARTAAMTAKEFSGLAYAAELSGIDQEKLAKASRKLIDPSKEAQAAISQLGISINEENGKAKTSSQLMIELAGGISKLKTPTEQAAASVQIFGDKGAMMVNMLKDGTPALQAMIAQAEKLGVVFDDDAAAAAEKFNDDIAIMEKSISGATDALGDAVIMMVNESGAVSDLTDSIAGLTQTWNGLSKTTQKSIIQTVTLLTGLAAGFLAVKVAMVVIPPLAAKVGISMTAAFGPIGLVVAGVTAAVYALIYAVNAANEEAQKLGQLTVSKALQGNTQEINNAKKALDQLSERTKVSSSIQVQELEYYRGALKKVGVEIDSLYRKDVRTGGIFVDKAVLDESVKTLNAELEKRKNSQETKKATTFNVRTQIDKQKTVQDVLQLIDTINRTGFGDGVKFGVEFDTPENALKLQKELESLGAITNRKIKSDKDTGKIKFEVQVDTTNLSKEVKGVLSKYKKEKLSVEPEVIDTDKALVEPFTQAIEKIKQGLKKGGAQGAAMMAQGLSSLVSLTSNIADQITGAFAKMAENNAESIRRQYAKYDLISNVWQQKETERMQADIDAFAKAEDDKIKILQQAAIERGLARDEEYLSAKEKLDKDFEEYVRNERLKFEADKAILDEKSLDKEQRILIDIAMEENWKNYIESLNEGHEEAIAALQDEFSERKEQDAQESANKIQQVEVEKDTKLQDMEKIKAKREKENAKKSAFIQWQGQVFALEATKNIQAAQAMVAGIAGAAQGFASMAAIPFVGIPLGIGLAAAIMSATIQSVNLIRSQFVLPPAQLFLATGGVAMGRSHAQGGVNAQLEGGEGTLDKVRTAQFINAADNVISGSGAVTLVFEPGSIIVEGDMTEDKMDMLSSKIAERFERRGIGSI
jgi:hypothetical protein